MFLKELFEKDDFEISHMTQKIMKNYLVGKDLIYLELSDKIIDGRIF